MNLFYTAVESEYGIKISSKCMYVFCSSNHVSSQVTAKRTNIPGKKQFRPRRFNPYMGRPVRRAFMAPPRFSAPYGYGLEYMSSLAHHFFLDLAPPHLVLILLFFSPYAGRLPDSRAPCAIGLSETRQPSQVTVTVVGFRLLGMKTNSIIWESVVIRSWPEEDFTLSHFKNGLPWLYQRICS